MATAKASLHLAGDMCFMNNSEKVVELLSWEEYSKHWPLIPQEELRSSAVNLRVGDMARHALVLLHKRRVTFAQAEGLEPAFVCQECYNALSPRSPWLCKYALANHMWLGRRDPLFRGANLAHEMLLALARVVTTKVVLRPDGKEALRSGDAPKWEFLFHQTGMVGSAILFGNASCTEALRHFPPSSIKDAFAVTFVAALHVGQQLGQSVASH